MVEAKGKEAFFFPDDDDDDKYFFILHLSSFSILYENFRFRAFWTWGMGMGIWRFSFFNIEPFGGEKRVEFFAGKK